jgi:hypothetical protein
VVSAVIPVISKRPTGARRVDNDPVVQSRGHKLRPQMTSATGRCCRSR